MTSYYYLNNSIDNFTIEFNAVEKFELDKDNIPNGSVISLDGNSSFKYLQNIYSSNDPMYQPVSVALAFTEDFINRIGEGACRIHGGGFEGTIQVYLNNKFVDEFIKYISDISDSFKVLNLNIRQVGTTEVIID